MRIAIFGGAFNPVHNEHIHIAEAAIKALKLDKLIVMPTATSPHKSGKLFASEDDRLNMCRLAFANVEKVEVSDYEIKQGGVSYSYLTCRHFRQLYPDADIYFVMGADMLRSFPTWKNPQEILSLVTLAACARVDESDFSDYLKRTESETGGKVVTIPYVGKQVSSTRIRTLAALGEDIGEYTPKEICQYIKDKEIYLIKNIQHVRGFLTESRWKHTLGVAVMCAENCGRANLTEEQAITMAALHDVSKYLKADSPYLEGFKVADDVPQAVVHQFSGAYVAGNYFGIKDEILLDAIRYHTSGRENMTDADKLLFLCDMLEEGRAFDGVDELRAIFAKDLDECLYVALKHQVEYLKTTNLPIYSLTERAYNYLKEKRK
jgi:nicotinate-nucleotide adenylyltransferase